MNNLMKKNRHKDFPYIYDFSKREEFYRNAPTNEIPFMKWFWHKPEAYILMKYGIYLVISINFLIGFLILKFYLKYSISSYILLVISFIFFIYFFIQLRNVKYNKDVTFFDMWIRDYK